MAYNCSNSVKWWLLDLIITRECLQSLNGDLDARVILEIFGRRHILLRHSPASDWRNLHTGLFISPSGISELDCATTKTDTAERSISIGRESLQVSVLPAIPGSRELLTSEGSWQTFLARARQSQPMGPDGLFVSQRTGSHPAGISCTAHELFCP